MDVLSFDVGLRNLGVAHVRVKEAFAFDSAFKTYASEEETKEEFKDRAMVHFLYGGWDLVQWRDIDVTDALEKDVRNVKKLSMISQCDALRGTLETLEEEWFPAQAPHIIVVEIQHNANATMRGVFFGIVMFFMRSMPDTVICGKSGSHKLKLCTALGVPEGAGLAAKTARSRRKVTRLLKGKNEEGEEDVDPDLDTGAGSKRSSSGWKRLGGGKWIRSGSRAQGDKYEDNKWRAKLAMELLLDAHGLHDHPALKGQKKRDDLADTLLQGLWVLWTKVAPRAPARRRRRQQQQTAQPKRPVSPETVLLSSSSSSEEEEEEEENAGESGPRRQTRAATRVETRAGPRGSVPPSNET